MIETGQLEKENMPLLSQRGCIGSGTAMVRHTPVIYDQWQGMLAYFFFFSYRHKKLIW